MNDTDKSKFFKHVWKFFKTACCYLLDKVLIDDDFLSHAEVADASIRTETWFSSVLFVTEGFPFLLPETAQEDLEI